MKRTLVLSLFFLLVTPAFAQFRHTQDIVADSVAAVADVNGDGLDDIVFEQTYRLNLGGGTFGAPQRVFYDRTQRIVGTLDFDGDGAADLLAVFDSFDPATHNTTTVYHLFHNLGGGAYVDLGPLPYAGIPLAGDFSGDGKDDLVMLTYASGSPMTLTAEFYRSNYDGTFSAKIGRAHV